MSDRDPQTIGANAGRSRRHNRQVVLGHVHRAGAVGRAQIARDLGLSTQAVSNIIAELEGEGLLRATGRRVAGRGLPVVQYALNPTGAVALGIEVRPDAVLATAVNLDGTALFKARHTVTSADPETVLEIMPGLRDRALESAGVSASKLLGAGVVMPGPFGMRGFSEGVSDLPGWQNSNAEALFGQALSLPVAVENDANAAAVSERVSGVARGFESYAFLYFGAGLGLGVVTGGRLLRGARGNAGEVGHIPVASEKGPVPLESRVSRLSARRHLAAAGIEADSIGDIESLYAARNPVLLDWLAQTVQPLSLAVQTIENLFDPQAIVFGGALPSGLIAEMIGGIQLADTSVAARPDRVGPRLLQGATGRITAAVGAAALIINQSFTPQIGPPH
ncbi:MAG: ROK family transcriptional regulator [Pseudomonadota bacterium]